MNPVSIVYGSRGRFAWRSGGLELHRQCFRPATEGGFLLQITPAERMTLELLAQGMPSPAIADSIGLTEPEVGPYLTALFAKMGVSTVKEAVVSAFRRGLLEH